MEKLLIDGLYYDIEQNEKGEYYLRNQYGSHCENPLSFYATRNDNEINIICSNIVVAEIIASKILGQYFAISEIK